MFYFADAHNIFVENFVGPTIDGHQFTAIRGTCYLKPRQYFKDVVDFVIPVPALVDEITLVPLTPEDIRRLFRDCLHSLPRLKSDPIPRDDIGVSNAILEVKIYNSLEEFLEQREMPIEYLTNKDVPIEEFNNHSMLVISYPLPSFFQGQELTFSIAYTFPMKSDDLFVPSSLSFNPKNILRHSVYSINTSTKCGRSVEEDIRAMLKNYNANAIHARFPLTKTANKILSQGSGIELEQILELRFLNVMEDLIPGRWLTYGTTNLFFHSAKKFWSFGEVAKAEQKFLKAIRRNPRHIPSLTLYALFLKKTHKDTIECGNYLKQAVEANPLNADTLGNYALFLASTGRIKEAELYFQEALEHVPDNANVLCNYAVFLKNEKNEAEEAQLFYEKAIKANPGHANARGNYALLLSQKKKTAADSQFKHLLSIMRTNPSLHWTSVLVEYYTETQQLERQKECEEILSTIQANGNEGDVLQFSSEDFQVIELLHNMDSNLHVADILTSMDKLLNHSTQEEEIESEEEEVVEKENRDDTVLPETEESKTETESKEDSSAVGPNKASKFKKLKGILKKIK